MERSVSFFTYSVLTLCFCNFLIETQFKMAELPFSSSSSHQLKHLDRLLIQEQQFTDQSETFHTFLSVLKSNNSLVVLKCMDRDPAELFVHISFSY